MSTPTDYGEPWLIEDDGTFWEVYSRDGTIITEEVIRDTNKGLRMLSCVNACAGMADPAVEIQAMRDEICQTKNILQQADLPNEPLQIQAARMVDQYNFQLGVARAYERQIQQANKSARAMREAIKAAHEVFNYAADCLNTLASKGRMPTGGEDAGNWEHCVQSHQFAQSALAKLEPFIKP